MRLRLTDAGKVQPPRLAGRLLPRGAARLIFDRRNRQEQAMAIDLTCDGADLCGPGPLWLGHGRGPGARIGESVRIGLTKAADRVLRFYEQGSPFVSGPARLRV